MDDANRNAEGVRPVHLDYAVKETKTPSRVLGVFLYIASVAVGFLLCFFSLLIAVAGLAYAAPRTMVIAVTIFAIGIVFCIVGFRINSSDRD